MLFHSIYAQDDVVVRQILSLSWRGFVLNRSTQPTRLQAGDYIGRVRDSSNRDFTGLLKQADLTPDDG